MPVLTSQLTHNASHGGRPPLPFDPPDPHPPFTPLPPPPPSPSYLPLLGQNCLPKAQESTEQKLKIETQERGAERVRIP